jgi:pimeloyl-ACP methyl ester carboxylesterase
MNLELITRSPAEPRCRTPILFVHGAWHGAWCWDEHFLPYFAEQGFTVHALSFRNHGRSDRAGSLRRQRVTDYVADVAAAVRRIGAPPALVGHSLGGFVVQKYLETTRAPAVVYLASVPPRGALGATIRTFRRRPWALTKANLQLRLWPIIGSPRLAHEAFFSRGMPQAQVDAYFARMQDESYLAFLDMVFLNLPRPGRIPRTPTLALGGAEDAIISPREVRATAAAYQGQAAILAGRGHDLMLDTGWQEVADRIIAWLRALPGLC